MTRQTGQWYRAVITAMLGLALGTATAFAQDASSYINVREFINKPEFKEQKDHTEAIRAAFAEAGKTRKHAVLFPPGHYTVSDTIDIGAANEIVGQGYPTITQRDPSKDIFYDENTWRKTIRGLQFRGGRDQLALGGKNTDQGFLLVSDCRFFEAAGVAVRFLGGPGYPAYTGASSYNMVEKCAFADCAQTLVSVSDDAHFHDAWISTKSHASNKAVIENYGVLSIQHVLGVPRVRGTDQRWIDNHSSLSVKKFRFGGEGGGFTPVVNYAKYRPDGYGSSVIIEDSYIFALGNNKRACAVYLEEIPNQLVIRNCNVAHVPAVRVSPKLDLNTYFAGARPGMLHFDIANNIGEFSGVLPEEMLAAAANRKPMTYTYPGQLTPEETRQALDRAAARAKTLPSAAPGEFKGHKRQTDPAKYAEIRPSTHRWDLDTFLDGVLEKNVDYLAVAEAGDDVILLQRTEKGSYPHVQIRNVQVDLGKTPFLTWRLKDNSADVKGGHFAVKVIENESQGMASLIENYSPDQYGYYAYDLRKVFGKTEGLINVDIKFYLCSSRYYSAMEAALLKKGDYFVIDFLRLEAE
jgi:hypothetical protein